MTPPQTTSHSRRSLDSTSEEPSPILPVGFRKPHPSPFPMSSPAFAQETQMIGEYPLACPDVIEIRSVRSPHLDGQYRISPEGRIDFPAAGSPRLQGRSIAEAGRIIAQGLGQAAEDVSVRVAEYRSRSVFLHGPVRGPERAIPYIGPERVTALLRRCGGLQKGAKWDEVHVVRNNISAGSPPQVFRVDLARIILHNDPTTDITLAPNDEVYIGETKQSRLGDSLPQWMQPVYSFISGLWPGSAGYDWRERRTCEMKE
jgi:polysaccharide biosynthesis/export protein